MCKKLTKILLLIMNLGTVLVATLEFSKGNFSRILTFIAIFPILIIPFIVNKTKLKLDSSEILLYYIFIFLADFLGCIINLYNTVSWYDLFVHFLSGIFSFILGYIILKSFNNKDSKIIKIIFCLGFAALVAVLWEIFEFGADNILNIDLQHHLDTGVYDTMEDMIVATIGSFIGMIYVIIKK